MKGKVLIVLIGLALAITGICVLAGNEKSALNNKKDVAEMQKVYTEVDSTTIASENNGKLIVTSGKLIYSPIAKYDSTFNIKVNSPVLVRTVEMYQWEEKKQQDNGTVTYSYNKVWSDKLINSSSFKEKNHINPTSKAYDTKSFNSNVLTVGAFTLGDKFRVNPTDKFNDFSNANIPYGYAIVGDYITNSADMKNPQIGDIRISYTYGEYNDVTVIGTQNGGHIDGYKTENNNVIARLENGVLSGKDMLNKISADNNETKWGLRVIGTVLVVAGLMFMASIINGLSRVPIAGNITVNIIGFISILLGLVISFLTIAISWLVVRPFIAICVVVAVIALIYCLKSKSKSE